MVPQVAILGKSVSAVGGGLVGVSVGDASQHVGVGVKIGAGEGSELGGEMPGGAMVRAAGECGSGGVVAKWAQGWWRRCWRISGD